MKKYDGLYIFAGQAKDDILDGQITKALAEVTRLGGNVLAANSDEEFAFVAERFRSAAVSYVVGEEELTPAWVITMEGGTKFFFGLYDAVPLGFTRD